MPRKRNQAEARHDLPSVKIHGILEVDVRRGVLYFHSSDERFVATPLRICGMKVPKKFGKTAIDCIDISLKRDSSFAESYCIGAK